MVRNRLKRWSREHFRALSKSNLQFGAEINVIFKPIDQGFYKGLPHDEFEHVLEKGVAFVQRALQNPGPGDRRILPRDGNDPHGR